MANENEWIESLGQTIQLVSSKKYCMSTDTVILADFSMPKPKEKIVADLGTGCGAIPLFWYSRGYKQKAVAVEIQNDACKQLQKSIKLNNLESLIKVLNQDLKNTKTIAKFGPFDLIVCNPPYKKVSTGECSSNISRALARHEIECTLDDVVNTSRKLLKSSGRLCMCNRVERLTDVLIKMRSAKIEPKKLRFVQQRVSKSPKFFLVEGKKGSKPGLQMLPSLIIESDEMKKIYGEFGEGH